MKKKIKIFGIGTSVILIMLSLSPAVTSNNPYSLAQEIEAFIAEYQAEINMLDAFLDSWTPDQDFPVEISDLIHDLSIELRDVLDPYLEELHGDPWTGMNGFWYTTNYVNINEQHPNWLFSGFCFALNNLITDAIILALLAGDLTVAVIMTFIIALIPWWVPDWLIKLIAGVIYTVLATIGAFLIDIMNDNHYGIVMFMFYTGDAGIWSPLFTEFSIFEQVSFPWDDPSIYWVGELEEQFEWHRPLAP